MGSIQRSLFSNRTQDDGPTTFYTDFVHFRTLWQFLNQKYQVPNQQATELYARQLETITLQPHEPIPDYFMRIRLLSTELTSADERVPVPDHHILRYALQGLPSSNYDRIKSIIAHTPGVTFDSAEDMLLRDSVLFLANIMTSLPLSDAISTIRRSLPATSNVRSGATTSPGDRCSFLLCPWSLFTHISSMPGPRLPTALRASTNFWSSLTSFPWIPWWTTKLFPPY